MASKIAFIGTHGVGKTVLTFTMAARLRTINVDADVAYENSRRSPFPINETTTLEGQMWIQAAQWKAELEATRRCGLVVCDRSILDNYAYMVRACGEQEYLHPFLKQWTRTYDALILVPIIAPEIVADAIRATSPPFQREIHEIIERLLTRFELEDRVVRLPQDRERHIPLVLDELRKRGIVRPEEKTLF